MDLNPKLLELIACPNCHSSFQHLPKASGLYCPHCQLLFPIREGIPILLPEEGVPYTPSSPEDMNQETKTP
jgi:uncharacterized protein YbaR (Trm112 family)